MQQESSVALVIIYNHQYVKNVSILERIYQDRFSNIFHLMPFYNGVESNVIPVYENSRYFQGYVTQGLKYFYNKKYTHYLFVADDLILNPSINERNYSDFFCLNANSCFLPGFITLHKTNIWWSRVAEAFLWREEKAGIEVNGLLPNYNQALDGFRKFGLEIKPLKYSQIWKPPGSFKEFARYILSNKILRFALKKIGRQKLVLKYPLVGGYSDIFIVNHESIKQFSHYCGIFAATELFVELAIPTAMALSANEIKTENETELKGKALWSTAELQELTQYRHSLKSLLSEFPDNYLYIHPIKLSTWLNDL